MIDPLVNSSAANHDRSDKLGFNNRRQGGRSSTAKLVVHATWDEAHNLWNWEWQALIIIFCQKTPTWIAFPPALFFHFFLKRDWGMAFGPIFAFVVYPDIRSMDLFLGASMGGVLCGVFKHIIRSPRPFWVVPEVELKEGVEEMSWGTPSAHSAIQGAVSAVLIYHDARNHVNWIINALVLLFCMYSRLYLAVHWPQDVVLGAMIGVCSGLVICGSNLHPALLNYVTNNQNPSAGLIFLVVGFGYLAVVWACVGVLNVISDSKPVPKEAIERYKRGVLRALRILKEDLKEDKNDTRLLSSLEGGSGDENDATNELNPASGVITGPLDTEEVEFEKRRRTTAFFMSLESAEQFKQITEQKKREQGVFFRDDIPFNPDSKVRFWYNAINVVGAYSGLALIACVTDYSQVEFKANLRWLGAFYATSFSFAAIVYTRTILRSVLPKKIFKWVRIFLYWFLGFFTYGVFPLSYIFVTSACP